MKSKKNLSIFTPENHIACLLGYAALITEIVVSGYYTDLDIFFFLTRFGIFTLYYAAIEKHYFDALGYVGLILVILSVYGIRKEYQKLQAQKFSKLSVLEKTNIKEPSKPKLSDCNILPKYARPECSKDNKELQKTYNEDLKEYNFQIKNSENQIKTIDVSLDFFEVQPLLIYCFLICAITYISVLGVKSPEIKGLKIAKIETLDVRDENKSLTNLEKVKRIETRNKLEKVSQEKLCKEYGISLSEFKRLRAKQTQKVELVVEPNKNNLGLEGSEEYA